MPGTFLFIVKEGRERINKTKYQLIKTNRQTIAIYIRPDGSIVVRAPMGARKKVIDSFVALKAPWIENNLKKMKKTQESLEELVISERQLPEYKANLKEHIRDRCHYFAEEMGVDYGSIKINRARTRWGSCNGRGDLNFSITLILLPKELIDYIIVHELAHRREMNHSKKFWKVVADTMPDYKERKEQLKEIQKRIKLEISG